MRSFQADCIFPVHAPPVQNGFILTEDDGSIVEVLPQEAGSRLLDMGVPPQRIEGLIVPGLINTHCHLELSCMRGQITEHKGLAGFVREFVAKRGSFTDAERTKAIAEAEEEMILNGIVAVGDISNGSDTFELKAKKNLYYHTFIECFDLHPQKTEDSFKQALALRDNLLQLCPAARKQVSIVAHAPYTVTPHLLLKICNLAKENGSILSFHNQESLAENDMFMVGEGSLIDMYKGMGLDFSWFKTAGQSSLRSILPFYRGLSKVLLVHNTFTSKEEVNWAAEFEQQSDKAIPWLDSGKTETSPMVYWATCPRANMYIENRLPDYSVFSGKEDAITLGTDSLASNHSLSVLEELKTILNNCPGFSLETGIRWATLNGAKFLGIDAEFGSFEKGKKPGLVWISHAGISGLSAESLARRIL
jgi:cytosine/adenosine deaminase-related metal-dependent hydrolase